MILSQFPEYDEKVCLCKYKTCFHFLCEMLIFASFCMEIKMNNLFTFHVYAYFMALRKQKTNIVQRDNKIVNMAYVG